MNIFPLLFRWFVWLLLITLESVIGFPWLSMYLAGEWVLSSSEKKQFVSIIFLSFVFSAVFSLSLTMAAVLGIIIWQVVAHTKKNAWWRWLVYLGGALLLGFFGGVSWSLMTGATSAVSIMILLRTMGGFPLGRTWQRKTLFRSPKS